MGKTWKKPEVSKTSQMSLCECTEEEMNDVNGGYKIGTCVLIGAGGDMNTLKSGIFLGFCYVVGV